MAATLFLVSLDEDAEDFARFCQLHACDLISESPKVYTFGLHADVTTKPETFEAILGNWPRLFGSRETMRDVLLDVLQTELEQQDNNITLIALTHSCDTLANSLVLHHVSQLLERQRIWRKRLWRMAALAVSPGVVDAGRQREIIETAARLTTGEGSDQLKLVDNVFFISNVLSKGSRQQGEIWSNLRILMDIGRDDASGVRNFLQGAPGQMASRLFWLPSVSFPDSLKRPVRLSRFLSLAIQADPEDRTGLHEQPVFQKIQDKKNEFMNAIKEQFQSAPYFSITFDRANAYTSRKSELITGHYRYEVINSIDDAMHNINQDIYEIIKIKIPKMLKGNNSRKSKDSKMSHIYKEYFLGSSVIVLPSHIDKDDENLMKLMQEIQNTGYEWKKDAHDIRRESLEEPYHTWSTPESINRFQENTRISRRHSQIHSLMERSKVIITKAFPVFPFEYTLAISTLLLATLFLFASYVDGQTGSFIMDFFRNALTSIHDLKTWSLGWGLLIFFLLFQLLVGIWRYWISNLRLRRRISLEIFREIDVLSEQYGQLASRFFEYMAKSRGSLLALRMHFLLEAQRRTNVLEIMREQAHRLWPGIETFDVETGKSVQAMRDAYQIVTGRLSTFLALAHDRERWCDVGWQIVRELIVNWQEQNRPAGWRLKVGLERDAGHAIPQALQAIRDEPFILCGTYLLAEGTQTDARDDILLVPLAVNTISSGLESNRSRAEDDNVESVGEHQQADWQEVETTDTLKEAQTEEKTSSTNDGTGEEKQEPEDQEQPRT